MPSFLNKLRGKGGKLPPQGAKKSSSMGSLYRDYSGSDQLDNRSNVPGGGSWDHQTVKLSSSYPSTRGPNEISGANRDDHSRLQSQPLNTHEISRLESENKRLKGENNLLRLEVEILLDMLAQKTAELDLMEGDMLKMKSILSNA